MPRTIADVMVEVRQRMVDNGWENRSNLDQACGLAEEAGEACKAVRMLERKGVTPERRAELCDELADVLMYVAHLAYLYDIDLEQAYVKKMGI
jgi:NTP pyrophosphatase (non-canonical NTP hydrolase)